MSGSAFRRFLIVLAFPAISCLTAEPCRAAAPLALLGTTDYTGPGAAWDSPYGLAVDGSGNVVVVGAEAGAVGMDNWRIRRYDPMVATLLGSTDYNGPANGMDRATGAAIGGAGDIVVVGLETVAPGNADWLIRRYDATLTTLLSATGYAGSAGGGDGATSVAIDGAGNVVVGGYEDVGAGSTNWRVRTYDATLSTLLATTDYDGPGGNPDLLNSLVVDGSGNVVAAGYEISPSGGYNWRLRTYDSALTTLLGSATYNGPGNAFDSVEGVCVDASSGDVFAAGIEVGATGGDNWRVQRYDAALTTALASTDYDGPLSGLDDANALALDGSGNLVVAGLVTGTPGGGNWGIRVYDPTLTNLLSATDYDGPAGGWDAAEALAVTSSGHLVVVGTEGGIAGLVNWRIRVYGVPCASFETAVSVAPAGPVACQPFTISVTVTNTGANPLDPVDLLGGPPRVDGTGGAVYVGGPVPSLPWVILPGSSTTFIYTYVATGAGSITLSTTPSGYDPVGSCTVSPGAVTSGPVLVGAPSPPDLTGSSLNPTRAPALYKAGETVTYVATMRNSGGDTATAVRLWDTIPAGSAYLGCGCAAGSTCFMVGAGPLVVWSIPDIAPGAEATATLYVAAPGTGTCLSGSTSPQQGFSLYGYGWNGACGGVYSVPIAQAAPDLDLVNAHVEPVKSVSSTSPVQGAVLTYSIVATNVCSDTATGIRLWDTVPAGASFLSASAGAVLSGAAVSWTLPNLRPGGTVAVWYTASVTGTALSCERATVRFANSGPVAQPDLRSAPVCAAVRIPILVVTKTGPAEWTTQDPVTWTIAVRNAGTDAALGVHVADTLPSPLAFVAATAGGVAVNGVVGWDLPGTLFPGETRTLTVTARGPDLELEQSILNTAAAWGTNSAGVALPPATGSAPLLLIPRLVVRVFPTPYAPRTAVGGTLKFSGLPAGAQVRIFAVTGALVRTLKDVKGHRLAWDGRAEDGREAAPGSYFYVLEMPGSPPVKGSFGLVR